MSTLTGLRITPKGSVETVELDESNLLDSFYSAIGCELIQAVRLGGNISAIFDEESKLTGAEPNVVASLVAETLSFRFLPSDYLAGAVIFLGHTPHGEHASLTEEQRQAVLLPTE